MLASDFVVIPVPPEDFGTQGLRVVHQAIQNAHQLNPRLELLGHLITRSDRRLVVHQSYESKLRKLYQGTVLSTRGPRSIGLQSLPRLSTTRHLLLGQVAGGTSDGPTRRRTLGANRPRCGTKERGMNATRAMIQQAEGHMEESMGVRQQDLRPKLSPVPSQQDAGRRPLRQFGAIDIRQVIPDPDQPRTEFDEDALERLAKSIRDRGQLSPISVRWSGELTKWVIVFGERRWRATKRAGIASHQLFFPRRGAISLRDPSAATHRKLSARKPASDRGSQGLSKPDELE